MGGTGVAPHSVPAKRAARRESLASSSEEGAALLGLSLQLARTGARRVWVTRRGGAREVWARRRPATEAREARTAGNAELSPRARHAVVVSRTYATGARAAPSAAVRRDGRDDVGGEAVSEGSGPTTGTGVMRGRDFRGGKTANGGRWKVARTWTTPQISRDRVQEGAARRRRVANRWRQSCRGQRTPRRIQKRTRTRT